LLALTAPASRSTSDLAGFLRDPEAPLAERPALSESLYCFRNFRWAQMTSLRKDGMKLIRGSRDDFFDPLQDPGETSPLAGEKRDSGRDALSTTLSRLKETARGRFAPGTVFRRDLPGYFGGTVQGDGAFLEEDRNRALPHPPDRAARVNTLLEVIADSESAGVNRAYVRIQELAALEPDNPTVLFWFARITHKIAEREGDAQGIRKAGKRFEVVLDLAPDDTNAFHMRVWCLLQLGEFEEAKKRLESLPPEHEKEAKTWELTGFLYSAETSNGREAKTWELTGFLYSAETSNGRANPCFDFSKAIQAFDTSLELNKNNPRLLQQLIALCKKQDETELQARYARMLEALQSEGWRRGE
jgi:hypothetical protein